MMCAVYLSCFSLRFMTFLKDYLQFSIECFIVNINLISIQFNIAMDVAYSKRLGGALVGISSEYCCVI